MSNEPSTSATTWPEANPALSISIVLGVTFPFNLVAGIPPYASLARLVTGGS